MTAPTTRETADHAELKRLAEAATPGRWTCKEGSTSYPECDDRDFWSVVLSPAGREIVQLNERGYHREDDRVDYDFDAAFIAAANPATVLSLLSEIAALRGRAEEADALASTHFVVLREKQDDAAILKHGKLEAERQRDELRKALEDIGAMSDADDPESYRFDDREGCLDTIHAIARAFLANQGADQ